MKLALLLILLSPVLLSQEMNDRAKNTVILDKIRAENLQIQLEEVVEGTFQESFSAYGELSALPGATSVLSSRVAGRVTALHAYPADQVKVGQELAIIETYLTGSPPPSLSLKALKGGTVMESHLKLGSSVQPEESLMTICDLSTLTAVATLPQEEARFLQKGSTAKLSFPNHEKPPTEVSFLRFSTTADATKGTVDALFSLPNPDLTLRPGLQVEFLIRTSQKEEVMMVPNAAIQGNPTDKYLYVEDFELPYAYVKVPVVTGRTNAEFTEILSGVFPGDLVVTSGAYFLSFSNGGGGLSLKEALDAAHGHEHNEDGTELSDSQRKKNAVPVEEQKINSGAASSLWFYLSMLLLVISVLLLLLLQNSINKLRKHSSSVKDA